MSIAQDIGTEIDIVQGTIFLIKNTEKPKNNFVHLINKIQREVRSHYFDCLDLVNNFT